MSTISIILVLLLVGLCLFGIYYLVANRAALGIVTTVVGIALILIFLLIALQMFGVAKFATRTPRPQFRYTVDYNHQTLPPPPRIVWL